MILTESQNWLLRIAALLVFGLFNLVVWALRNKPKVSYAIAWCIAAYLFIYKVGDYTYLQCIGHRMDYPLEFSALSYIAFAIMVLFGGRKGDVFGVFTATLAGAIYCMSWWISPVAHIEKGLDVMALVNHHALYFGGILMAANCRHYSVKSMWQIILGTCVFVAYAWLMLSVTPYVEAMGAPVIMRITNSNILYSVMTNVTPLVRAIYYICAIALLLALIAGFYALNNWQAKRRVAKGLPKDYYAKGLSIFTNRPNPYQPFLDVPLEPPME